MSYIVALTGGIGSGKSTVAESFARHGVNIVDADIIARQVVAPGEPALDQLHQRFGNEIILADGSLNRPALREKIFSYPPDKEWVNQLLHPIIHARTQQLFAQADTPYVLWVVPLLIENGLQTRANRVLVVDVEPQLQLSRTLLRDRISRQQAENIIAAQVSREKRLACADDIIDNSGDPKSIEPRVALLHCRYLEFAASVNRQDIAKHD
ncbi:dephospho-CoA kinase [Rahnella variigena]|jgi:dephospho-CoA kinase|uniref:Dephospho-CoA kinase n=1 Tax=Rahnella variigena TaxID=574964 RepID=A0ABX9PV83_9GAMM|nr:dephospho-CoA kinase [Rahnella variigena]RJT54313.1 dephospho-CoA kinase [Rahnella variigena]RKF68121.1 dephospho-CoA kinase [Rahnella variigena]